jgi:hypothetical protein
MEFKKELYRQLLELPHGISVIHYLENKLTLPSDNEITAAYHSALRSVCESIAQTNDGVAESVSALAFLDKYKPYSPRMAGRRPMHYWEAAEPWSEAVLKVAMQLPRVLRPAELLRQARFVAAWTRPQDVLHQLHTGTSVVARRGAMTNRWSISVITKDAKVYTHPTLFHWGVLSARNVEARAVEYDTVDGRHVVAVTLFRPETNYDCQRHCIATELLLSDQFHDGGRWGPLYVAHGWDACELRDAFLRTPCDDSNRRSVRVADVLLDVLPYPEYKLQDMQTADEDTYCGRLFRIFNVAITTQWPISYRWSEDNARPVLWIVPASTPSNVCIGNNQNYYVRLTVEPGTALRMKRVPGSLL